MLSRAANDSLAALDGISVGSGAGIAASSRRGSTLKGTKFFKLVQTIQIIFFNNSVNFGPPHVEWHDYLLRF